MNIDVRIQKIMKKMEKLSQKHPEFPCGEFPPKWSEPLTEQAAAEYEKRNGISLPEDYRRFITMIAASGTQPFYGLYSIVGEHKNREIKVEVDKKFPFTVRKPLNIMKLSDEEYDAIYETGEMNVDAGYILLCHEGCGMYSILIVNTDDKETYGTVWYYDLANDAGIYPLINPADHRTMSFLDWLEYYVDKTLELDDSDYFSYGELAGIME